MRPAGLRDQTGLIGKIVVAWLVVLVIVGVAATDAISIVITRFHTADVAGNAASDAAATYRLSHSVPRACQAAATTIRAADPKIRLTRHGCTVDPSSGDATIVVRRVAATLIAGRLSFTKSLATITDTETAPPPTV